MRKSIKQRLADKVNADLGHLLSAHFEAEDFRRNYGSNGKNDWCSWSATAGSEQLASFTPMTELVNKKEKLVFIGGKQHIGTSEIT